VTRLLMIYFVIATALGTAVPALAQNSSKVWRLGVLTLPTSTSSPVFDFRSVVFPELAKQGTSKAAILLSKYGLAHPTSCLSSRANWWLPAPMQ
jgi:hypothetical protein